MFIVEGKGSITVDGITTPVSKGDVIIYNPLITHFEESNMAEPMDMFFMAIDRFEVAGLEKNYLLPTGSDFIYKADKYYNIFYTLFRQILPNLKKKVISILKYRKILRFRYLCIFSGLLKRKGSSHFLFLQTVKWWMMPFHI